MPRKRMIDPSFWRDEKIGRCPMLDRLLFIGLWNFAEDTGVGRANPLLIKADIFPYDTLREADIKTSLAHLASLGLIQLYIHDNQQYFYIPNFKKHQTINKPTPSTLPLPEEKNCTPVELPEDYRSTTVVLPEDSCHTTGGLPSQIEEKRKEEKLKENLIKEKRRASDAAPPYKLVKPTVEEVAVYCKERHNLVNAQAFMDYYDANGWKVGRVPMKDWKAAVRTWERRGKPSSVYQQPAHKNYDAEADFLSGGEPYV